MELLQTEFDILIPRANFLFPEIPVFLSGHLMAGFAVSFF
jgi:hypothetical protein